MGGRIRTDTGGGGGVSDAFVTIQPDSGTSPTAEGSDTLVLTSPDITISGDSSTDTITFSVPASAKGNAFETIDCPAGTDPVASSPTDTLTLSTDANLTITGDSSTDTIAFAIPNLSGTNTGDQNLFETISCPAGTNPVADSTTDTLTLTASDGNITITGTAGTDTVDFTIPNLSGTNTGDQNIWSTIDCPAGSDPVPDGTSDTLTLTADANMTITGNSTTDTIAFAIPNLSGTNTGDQSLFETISCPAGTNPVADSTTDTLTLTASDGNITITGTSGTDTVDFTIPNLSGTNTGDQNLFQTIACDAGTNPVADSTTDTLTLTSSDSSVTITGTSGTDTVDFAVSPSSIGVLAFTTIAVSGESDVVADSATDTLTLASSGKISITTTPGTDTVTIGTSTIFFTDISGLLELDTQVQNTLPINNGGTGAGPVSLINGSIFFSESNAHAIENNEFFWDNTNKKMGIGNQAAQITIAGAAEDGSLHISEDAATIEHNLMLTRAHTGTAQGADIVMAKARGTTASRSVVANNDVLGLLRFAGFDGTDFEVGAIIGAQISGTPGAGDMPTKLIFQVTADGSASPATALTIDQDKSSTFEGTVDMNDNDVVNMTVHCEYYRELPTDDTYTILRAAKVKYEVQEVTYKCSEGTITGNVKIDGTSITGLNSLSISSTEATTSATAANTIDVDDTLEITFSSNSDALNVEMSFELKRVS